MRISYQLGGISSWSVRRLCWIVWDAWGPLCLPRVCVEIRSTTTQFLDSVFLKDPCPRSFLSAQSCSLNCKGRFVLCQLKPDFIHGECKRESSPLCEEGSRTGIHPSPRDSEVPFAWGKQTRTVWLVSGKTEEEVGAIPAILGHAIRKLSTPDSLCLYTFHRINPNLCPFCQLAYSCWLGRLTHPLTLCVYTSFVVFFFFNLFLHTRL